MFERKDLTATITNTRDLYDYIIAQDYTPYHVTFLNDGTVSVNIYVGDMELTDEGLWLSVDNMMDSGVLLGFDENDRMYIQETILAVNKDGKPMEYLIGGAMKDKCIFEISVMSADYDA